MQIVHQMPLAALGMGAAFTIVYGVADPMAALAEVRQVDVTGRYFIGGAEENFAEAREQAKKDALRLAAEQVSVLVESYSESHNMELTKDEIQTIAAAILSVKKTEFSFDTDSENNITVLCHILATADTSAITEDMLRERNPIRREAQIAEYEAVLKAQRDEPDFATFQKLAALDPSNLVALQSAYYLFCWDKEHGEEGRRHLERVYASHAHDLEAAAYLADAYYNGYSVPKDLNMALVYANKGIEEAKKRYSQQEIDRIVNSSYVENLALKSDLDENILLNPVYLCYSVKCQAMDELIGEEARFYQVEPVGVDRLNIRYKTDW